MKRAFDMTLFTVIIIGNYMWASIEAFSGEPFDAVLRLVITALAHGCLLAVLEAHQKAEN